MKKKRNDFEIFKSMSHTVFEFQNLAMVHKRDSEIG